MTKIILNTILIIAICLGTAFSQINQEEEQAELTRLCVVNLVADNVLPSHAAMMSEKVRKAFNLIGMYYVLPLSEMTKRLNALNQKLPDECYTEKCAIDAGQLFASSKVILGEFVNDRTLHILRLKMYDLEDRIFENKITIASDCSKEKWDQMAKAAVYKLLNMEPKGIDIKLVKYKGKEVHHEKEWAIAGGVTVAGAIIYAAASGAISPSGEKNSSLEVSKYKTDNPAYNYGAFADVVYSARAHGMGGAFIALSDDANAMAFNPAGMVRAKGRNVTAGYLRYDFDYGNYPYFYTGYVNKVTRTISHGQAIITSNSSSYGSSETQVITSFAKIFDDISEKVRPFSIGMSIKFLMMNVGNADDDIYSWQDYAVEGGGFGASCDIGGQFELNDRITFAFVFRDLISTIRYKNVTTDESYNEGIPQNIIIGGHYRILNSMNLVLDGNKSISLDTDDHVSLGMEKWFYNVFAVRLGMSQYFAMKSRRRYHFGTGLMWEFKNKGQKIGVDYSYEYFPLDEQEYKDLSGSHRFALNYKF